MSKKSRRKQLSEKVLRSRKEKQVEKKPNPFELKFNKQKHQVAGQRKQAAAVGLPLLSRQRAFDQRKRTLLVDYRQFGKANQFVDRRLGEKNPNLTPDQKMALRFAAERARRYKAGGIRSVDADFPSPSNFQLTGADSILTHRGKALSEIEKLNDRPVFDEDEEESGQLLGADFVKLANFGGGGVRNADSERDDTNEGGDRKKSRKELIEEMIENSKRTRFEMQMQREKVSDLTADLDAQWKDAVKQNIVSQWVRTGKDDDAGGEESKRSAAPTSKPTAEKGQAVLDYDRLVHEMLFEPKAVAASEKLKNGENDTTGRTETANPDRSETSSRKSKSIPRNHVTGDDDIFDLQRLKRVNDKPFVVRYDSEGRLIEDESPAVEVKPVQKKQQCGIEFLGPRIESNFNPERKKRRVTAKGEAAERQKLTQKVKKEFRGAVRELKKDNEFLARQQLNEQRQQDSERREKVKALMKSLVSQETECRKLKKKKR